MVRVIFKFKSGPMDGKTVLGRLGEQGEADRYYTLTAHGRVGQQFRMASQYAIDTLTREQLKEEKPHRFQQHQYRVTGRLEDDEKVFVHAEYVQEEG